MIKLEDNGKTHKFFDKHNMMLERAGWADHHKGDALWRTSLALIASGKSELLEAVKGQITEKNGKYGFMRHPELVENDCTRDQAIPTLIALSIYDHPFYRKIIKNLSFRIKKDVTWQDAYLWAKERYTIWRIISFYRFFGLKLEPSYSTHLFCWQIWHSGQRMRLFKWFLIKYIIPKDNYLCRALLGVKEDIPKLIPMCDFRWQRDSPWLQGWELSEEESEYNCLDLEVLEYIKNS